MKTFLASFFGIIVAFLLIMFLEPIGHVLFPLPVKIDPTNLEEILANIHLIPTGAYICVILAHGLGLLGGLLLARSIDKNTLYPLFLISGLLLLGTVANLAMIPHPIWFSIADVGMNVGVAALMIYNTRIKRSASKK